ncbi:hypothetical protein [Abyssisolibacter fermentans]|uniref:hypothetical protein n=1 Tax=Abyssisolibacter fermentans TaxID=1766203 RepID=UPI0008313B60|nr:hypothetical protein [Abyssisolibacter fermentans]
MRKMFKCPICGEETISIKDKRKLDYRFKTKIKCSNCNSVFRQSYIAALVLLCFGLVGVLIVTRNFNLVIKCILIILLSVLYFYVDLYLVPIVKYDE